MIQVEVNSMDFLFVSFLFADGDVREAKEEKDIEIEGGRGFLRVEKKGCHVDSTGERDALFGISPITGNKKYTPSGVMWYTLNIKKIEKCFFSNLSPFRDTKINTQLIHLPRI